MKTALILLLAATAAFAQPKKFNRSQNNASSPAKETSVTINGKTLNISYSAPSVRKRTIFGDSGILKGDGTYPVWRFGADEATQFHTDADLAIGSFTLPKGDYSLWIDLDAGKWQLIFNKKFGWGTDYDKSADAGRVPMTMSKPPAPVEQLTITLSSAGGSNGKLAAAWSDMAASVAFTVK